MLDLRKDPVILNIPKFNSKYASLMVTAYDHYVNIPMATRLGDFQKPEKMLLYSARTEGYSGEHVAGVDRVFEASGDFGQLFSGLCPTPTSKSVSTGLLSR